MPFNPYAADPATIEDAVPQYSMPRGTYAAPSLEEGDAYIDEFGWSARLRTSAVEIPSAQRLGVIPRYDSYPDPSRAPEEWYDPENRDHNNRHKSEDQQGVAWPEKKGVQGTDSRWDPNPRLKPPPESRITQLLSPGNYAFTRPFDQFNRTHGGDPATGSKRQFNGWHFSMADNKRDFEAVGSMPVRSRRNTYRTEPAPWDLGIVDIPEPPMIPVASTTYDMPLRSRSWRL